MYLDVIEPPTRQNQSSYGTLIMDMPLLLQLKMTHTYLDVRTYVCMCTSSQELDSVREKLSNKEKDFKDLKSASRELRYENEQLINKLASSPSLNFCVAWPCM